MAIPDFDAAGNLPPGAHAADEEQVQRLLVDAFPASPTRAAIYGWWLQHRRALGELVEVAHQWLAGSFASDKPDPADVDVVTFLDGPAFDELPTHRQLLVRSLIAGHYTEDFWACDTHPVLVYPEGHLAHAKSNLARQAFEGYFGHDRDGRPRGFVQVAGP